jgi:uncharacterized membrane protein
MMSHLSSDRRLRGLLLLSLCVNVALVAYVAVQWQSPAGPLGAMPLKLVQRVAERLPPDDGAVLSRIYQSREAQLLPLQADYSRSLRSTLYLASQPQLDKAALRAAIKDARDKRIKVGDAVIDMFEQMLEDISTDGRRQLLKGFTR